MKPRERIIRILLRILIQPKRHTRRALANEFELGMKEIGKYIKAIKNGGVNILQEKKAPFRYWIEPDNQFDELRYLQPLTNEDKYKITQALNQKYNDKEIDYLNNKLSSLYDFQQLGLESLRRPALERLNQLEAAIKIKKKVILKNYRSNSNDIRDRLVEVFHIDPELDTLQAFDPKEIKIKHFKLSRIDRVVISEESWEYENRHHIKPTDVFRIAMANQKMIQLEIDVYAYNSLIDNYPLARGKCRPIGDGNNFDFQDKVNPKFLGLINFIMNNAGHVKIISPSELKEKVQERVNILLKELT